MSDKTKIEWTDATWNIVTGCSVVSPGCTNCYAMKLAGTRLKNHPSRVGLTEMSKAGPVWNGKVRFNEQWLDQPLKWKKSRRIFVCAHGDLFHEDVSDEWIDKVFAIMALCPQHTFQVLTKRPERMQGYICKNRTAIHDILSPSRFDRYWPYHIHTAIGPERTGEVHAGFKWPMSNVWLGVSAENQEQANKRIPPLLDTPAAIRFVSLEPQLEEIDLYRGGWSLLKRKDIKGKLTGKIDWVIQGCESGNNARFFCVSWAAFMRDQCLNEGVPYFLKQVPWVKSMPDDGSFRIVKTPKLDGVQHLAMPGQS